MGILGKLFEKKSCDICGGEIGLLGNRKLEDGNLCKECASKLSPLFSDRRESTVEQIREQLEYREQNKEKVAAFNVTRTIGTGTKVLLDEDAHSFLVSSSSRWRDMNPDIIEYRQVTGCSTEVRENRTEVRKKNDDGTMESYNPPRYDIDYDVYVTIHINSPYFDEITFRVNEDRIERQGSIEWQQIQRQAEEIQTVLLSFRKEAREKQ